MFKRHEQDVPLRTKLIRYANQSVEQIDLAEIAVPYLENLQNTVDETIHLGILNNNEILYINKLEPKIKRFACPRKWELLDLCIIRQWVKPF